MWYHSINLMDSLPEAAGGGNMFYSKKLNLQLFGGEGAGDGGSEGITGENTSDAGKARLLELGVPKDKLKNGRDYGFAAKARQDHSGQVATADPAADAATAPEGAKDASGENSENPKKATWDELMKDPEYNQRMQQTIQAALRRNKGAAENLEALAPALELLARKYNLDPENLDYKAVAKAVSGDAAYYEELALEMGVSVETAMEIDGKNRDTSRQQRTKQRNIMEQAEYDHFQNLVQQGQALKGIYPTFDLATEIKNPKFVQLTRMGMPFSVQDAYEMLHRKELAATGIQNAVRTTQQQTANSIRSGMNRPVENGTSGQAPSSSTINYASLTREQQRAYANSVRANLAAGKKVGPGDIPYI